MDQVKMPEFVRGEWVYKKSLANKTDCFLFARKKFTLDYGSVEADFWITAHCSYQLFVNDRLVGFGPRANNSSAASYVDQYNISYYLQQGVNVIGAKIYYSAPPFGRREAKIPGLWCQLNIDRSPFVWSDRSWDVCDGECCSQPRARLSPEQGMTEFTDLRLYPVGWTLPGFKQSKHWIKSDMTAATNIFGGALESALVAPNSLEDNSNFDEIEQGVIEPQAAFTHFRFDDIFQGFEGIYTASAFVFSETDNLVPVKIYSDDPYKLFCNNRMVKLDLRRGTPEGDSEDAEIQLRKGWNRLLLIQNATKNGIGGMLIFPGMKQIELKLFQDTIQDAPLCWNIAGPLKLPLREATPSLKFERLDSKSFSPDLYNLLDISSYLKTCLFKKTSDNVSFSLSSGEYILFKLDFLKYGFPHVFLDASEGDIVDFTIGHRLDDSGFPAIDRNIRGTHSIICHDGVNQFNKFTPAECLYLLVSVRRAKGEVKINQAAFDDYVRPQRNEASFRSSDEELNLIWDVGKKSLRRSSAYIHQNEPRAARSVYMCDAYIYAVNMINAFGDYHLSEALLRQFAQAQFENGDITALSFGKGIKSQINHLFLFPVWLNYHYKTSGDDGFLHEMLPNLDLTFEFFETLLDEETGMLCDIDQKFLLQCHLNNYGGRRGIATDVNAMYCRFLLSAGEVYRAANRPETLAKCFRLAANIATKLKKLNWQPEEHIFSAYSVNGIQSDERDPLSNFSALYSGVSPATEFENIFFRFFNFDKPFAIYPELTNLPYFNFLFLETLFVMDQAEWGIRYLKDYWSRRIDKTAQAWKKLPDSPEIAITDFSGGGTISPNVFLVREVAGVRIAEPGYATIYFNPAIDSLDWAEVIIPTSYGRLKVRWEKLEDGSLDVTIDAKFPLKVLPEMEPEIIKNTVFRLGENVSLLDPGSTI